MLQDYEDVIKDMILEKLETSVGSSNRSEINK